MDRYEIVYLICIMLNVPFIIYGVMFGSSLFYLANIASIGFILVLWYSGRSYRRD
jgi:hypothetical protein